MGANDGDQVLTTDLDNLVTQRLVPHVRANVIDPAVFPSAGS